MKSVILTGLFVFLSASVCFSAHQITILCSGDTAIVTAVGVASGARYVGATAYLSNGDYYDFPAQSFKAMKVGAVYKFTLPSKYSATKIVANLWEKKKKSKKSWSDRVVNPQGYIMEGIVGEAVSCEH